MQQLYLTGSGVTAATLGANQTSQRFQAVTWEPFTVYLNGAFSSQTATMQFSHDGVNWATFSVDLNGSGTPTSQTWVGTAEVNPRAFAIPGVWFRFTVSNGGSPAIKPWVSGAGVVIDRTS